MRIVYVAAFDSKTVPRIIVQQIYSFFSVLFPNFSKYLGLEEMLRFSAVNLN